MSGPDTAEKFFEVRRRFARIGSRRVHYRVMGSGPPAVFIHSSPTDSSFVVPEMAAVADAYTCFAFDTPGFGLSDPLPGEELEVADLADATAAAMRGIGLPPCPVFGSHTGAAIGLEMGLRHPELVTGLVLDGVPAFDAEETGSLFDGYFAPLVIDPLGGHFASTWTRFRDQTVWFPWTRRLPGNFNRLDLGAPETTHRWTSMFFDAAAHYKPAYRGAINHGQRALNAAAALDIPAIFTAVTTDMLHPHLRRLPPLKPGQEIRECGASHEDRRRLTREGFARFGSPGEAPVRAATLAAPSGIERQFIDMGSRQAHLRYAGDPANPPLLLVHDLPGSAAMIERVIAACAADHFVLAFDLPGSGATDPLDEGVPLEAYACFLWDALDAIGIRRTVVQGRGLGSSVAIAMAAAAPERTVRLIAEGVLLPDRAERAELRARYAPLIEIKPDGSHWYRTWLMLRDSLIWWPWYRTEHRCLRSAEADFAGEKLHRWTVEVMRQSNAYHRAIEAVIEYDTAAALAELEVPLSVADHPEAPFFGAYQDRLRRLQEGAAAVGSRADRKSYFQKGEA